MKAYINGTCISCEDENKIFSVLVEDKGKIVYTGNELPYKYKSATKVNLKGKSLIPAFADTHMHFASWAMFNSTIDVREAIDFEHMGNLLKDYYAKNPKLKFIISFGCTAHTVKEGRLPNRDDLDKMLEIPLMIIKYDGHAGVANSQLIKMFSDLVTEDEGFDENTGWLYQNAFYEGVNFVSAMVPIMSLLKGQMDASNKLAELGYGLIHTAEGVGFKNDLDVDSIRLTSYAYPSVFRIYFQTMDIEKVLKRKMTSIGGCFSLALDGCFGSEDAALFEPYSNDPKNKGFMPYTQEEINSFCIKANRENLQITMHAIGDAAIEMAIKAYEAADKDHHRNDARNIIIHADLINPDQMERAARLNVIIAVQPEFLDWKQEPGEYLEKILNKERLDKMLPLKSMIEKGLRVTSGSDAPCTIPNPIVSLYNCCNHPNPKESLSIEEALRVMVSWGAYSSYDENKFGTLKVGLLANMVVLNKNVLEVEPKNLMDVKVLETYMEGEPFKKNGSIIRLLGRAMFNKYLKKKVS